MSGASAGGPGRAVAASIAAAAAAALAAGAAQRPAAWPNEPPGFRVISEQPFDELPSLGWRLVWNDRGYTRTAADSGAPHSPPGMAEFRYPPGFQGGIAPGTAERSLPRVRTLYVGMWWRASSPWQGHNSNVNKIQFLFPHGGGDIAMVMYGPPGGPYELRVIPQFPDLPSEWLVPNAGSVPVTLGQWHRIEWLISYGGTGDPTGIVRWWLDGRLVGSYFNVPFPRGELDVYKISPTWGGMGDVKTERDHFQYDHVRISGR